jgi:hypothetical protein
MNPEDVTLDDLLGESPQQEQTLEPEPTYTAAQMLEFEQRVREDERQRNAPTQDDDEADDNDLVTVAQLRAERDRFKADAMKEVESLIAPQLREAALSVLAPGADQAGRDAVAKHLANLDMASIKAVMSDPNTRELFQALAEVKSAKRVTPPGAAELNASYAKQHGMSENEATRLAILKGVYEKFDEKTLREVIKR